MNIRLEITAALGRTAPFEHEGPQICIGRDPQCELPLKEEGNTSVSSRHARIDLTTDGAFLRDLESTNGTFLNDRRIEGRVALNVGDLMRLGRDGSYLKVIAIDTSSRSPKLPGSPIQTRAYEKQRAVVLPRLHANSSADPELSRGSGPGTIDKSPDPGSPGLPGHPKALGQPPPNHNLKRGRRLIDRLMQSFKQSYRRVPKKTAVAAVVAIVVLIGGFVIVTWLRQTPDPTPNVDHRVLADKAHAFLKTYCFRCHGGAETQRGLDVTSRVTLLHRRKKTNPPNLTPGDPDESFMWKRIIDPDEPMPPKKEKEQPSQEEKEMFRKWILAGAPAITAEPARALKTPKDILTAIKNHLAGKKPEDRRHQRYFTLANIYNHPATKERDLAIHRAAFAKLANSLTWQPTLVFPLAIDKEETVYALDLRDLGWNNADLLRLIQEKYPYALRHDDDADQGIDLLAQEVYLETGTRLPYIRVDWFLARASQSPLYEQFLELPVQVEKLEEKLNVSFKKNFEAGKLARAGFRHGDVSDFNRLIERHESSFGAYWKSYDFKSNEGRSDIFRFPLGPFIAGKDSGFAFVHAGGEMIFNLPNHMQAYYLTNENGRLIPDAPEDVVHDKSRTSGTQRIVNGLSCIHCHREGIIPKHDEMLDGVAKNLPASARRKLEQLHPDKAKMAEYFAQDADRFQNAATDVMKPFLKDGAGELEPIGFCARSYLTNNLGIEEVASELGFGNSQELVTIIRTNTKLRQVLGLGPLAEGQKVTRDQWENNRLGLSRFQLAAEELKLGVPLR